MEYTPQEKEILRQHYRRPWSLLVNVLARTKPWIGWVIYGLVGSLATVFLAVSGPSIFNVEPFLGSSFRFGGIPFNAFSTEVLPGISPRYPLRLSVALTNFFILTVCLFVIPLLIYRRRRMIAVSRLIFLAIVVAAGLIFLVLGVRGFNQPLLGGAIHPDEFRELLENY